MNSAWKSRYELAVEAAQRAGQTALGYFDRGVAVEWKANHTPVTIADREAEQVIRQAVLKHFPDDAFLGEEFGASAGGSGFRWIIDPIDGTKNFVRDIPFWGTLVGLEYQGELIAGVTVIPPLRQVFRALKGDGAYRGERRLSVSALARMDQAQVFYSGISWFMQSDSRGAFLELVDRTDRQRGFGDFYGFMLLAQGSGEIMVDYGVSPWDIAALKPIIEEAGGRFTDWDGNPTVFRPDVLASNGPLHAETLALLQQHRGPGFDAARAGFPGAAT